MTYYRHRNRNVSSTRKVRLIARFASCFLFVLIWSLTQAQRFTDVTEEAGIEHAFRLDLANFGGGGAVLDFNNDGFEDLYLPAGDEPDRLYRNNGDGTFTDVIAGAGFDITDPIHTQGAVAADVDRDGDKDLLVTTLYWRDSRVLSPNLLFLNNGDGTFTDVTEEWGLTDFVSNSQGATFGDINADGYPDLYVSNYMASSPDDFSVFNQQTITENFLSAHDFLFLNLGGTYFKEVSHIYRMNHNGFGFQGVLTDWDNDRDLDILIANDFGYKAQPNVALQNEFPDRLLSYQSQQLRLNYGMNAMGIAAGDVNFDGWMDYYITNIHASLFVQNIEGKDFVDVGNELGVAKARIERPDYVGVPVSWGTIFFDYDHDTDLDLFVNNGALNPDVRPNHNFFFECSGYAQYREVGARVGLDDPRIGRGAMTFDYDNDGDLDLLVINQHPRELSSDLPEARTILYRNDHVGGNWLKIKLEGVYAEKDGIGSRVEIKIGDRLLIREIDGGSSHMSQNSTIAHFGVADAEVIDSVTVKWIGGKTQSQTNVSSNQLLTIRESDGSLLDIGTNDLILTPSPFGNEVILEYRLSGSGPMEINVYDIAGKWIDTILRRDLPASTGIVRWSRGDEVQRGVYIFQMKSGENVITKQAIKL